MPDWELENACRAKGRLRIAGIDEAGRGPLAGPVVAAAVIFRGPVNIEGVDDSKKVPEHKRDALAGLIRRDAEEVGIGIVSHEEIDNMNILRATHLAMQRALDGLSQRPDMLLVDGNSFGVTDIPLLTVVGGDAICFSIAAASIIAKTERDNMMREMDAIYPHYGFARNKGYGTAEHLDAIRKYGLSPIHRRSFRVHAGLEEG